MIFFGSPSLAWHWSSIAPFPIILPISLYSLGTKTLSQPQTLTFSVLYAQTVLSPPLS